MVSYWNFKLRSDSIEYTIVCCTNMTHDCSGKLWKHASYVWCGLMQFQHPEWSTKPGTGSSRNCGMRTPAIRSAIRRDITNPRSTDIWTDGHTCPRCWCSQWQPVCWCSVTGRTQLGGHDETDRQTGRVDLVMTCSTRQPWSHGSTSARRASSPTPRLTASRRHISPQNSERGGGTRPPQNRRPDR